MIAGDNASSTASVQERPRLRPISVRSATDGDMQASRVIFDPSGLSPAVFSISDPVLYVLSLLDGEHALDEVQRDFQRRYAQPLSDDDLTGILKFLREGYFLENAEFEDYYARLVAEYQACPVRHGQPISHFGIGEDLGKTFDEMMASAPSSGLDGRIDGLISPHLDYPRGKPCYAAAYSALRNRPPPERVVILGTNHFGRSASVCLTGKAFSTPLGVTACDTEFATRLEARCGPLRDHELDHLREHSVELQVLWLQHLFGAERFSMVAVLCPDPCGPTGTKPADGDGVDLRDFAQELGELIRQDDADTLLVAGADLSHVGSYFGCSPPLDDDFLVRVGEYDERVLRFIEERDPEGLRTFVAERDNPTQICSIGCIYALLVALQPRTARRLGYHQAVTREMDNCVTCTAFAFTL